VNKLSQSLGLALAIFLFLAPVGSRAIFFGGLGIRPANPDLQNPLSSAWFIYQLLPGESRDDAVLISNTSTQVLQAKLYTVDATVTDGAFVLAEEKEGQKRLGSWVKLALDRVSLEPGEEKEVPFVITIPFETEASEYLGGIVLESLDPSKSNGVSLVTRVGVRIYETVPGEMERKLSLMSFWQTHAKVFLLLLGFCFFLVLMLKYIYVRLNKTFFTSSR